MSLVPGPQSCNETICITCRDEATAVRVLELRDDGVAVVDAGHSIEEVCVDLIDAAIGDVILVHAGVAIGVLRETLLQKEDEHGGDR